MWSFVGEVSREPVSPTIWPRGARESVSSSVTREFFLLSSGKTKFFRVGCGGATGISAGLVTAPIFWQDPTNQFLAESSIRLYTELAESGKFSEF